jgi:hypothetical protein
MVFRAIAVGVALSGGSNYGEFVANLWRIYGDVRCDTELADIEALE